LKGSSCVFSCGTQSFKVYPVDAGLSISGARRMAQGKD
jgi:hypothetical protein